MTLEIEVLRALLRLSRRRALASLGELLLRVDADPPAVRRAVASLARSGLVHRAPSGAPSLTLAGFAVAVATTAAAPPRTRSKPRAARVLPLVRRPAA